MALAIQLAPNRKQNRMTIKKTKNPFSPAVNALAKIRAAAESPAMAEAGDSLDQVDPRAAIAVGDFEALMGAR
jgi:hypothetical protein